MRVELVVPVALPCTPRGVWQGAVAAPGRRVAVRTGLTGSHTSHTSATRPVGIGHGWAAPGMLKRCFGAAPLSAVLREMLLAWRVRCPRVGKELHRVFPGPGRSQEWPKPRIGDGGPLLYQNFRKRYWAPAFKALKLPYVTPHSARHSFISTLQAQGIEVGLVAQIAGHANPTVTLGHYTQAGRGASAAIEALDRAYGS